MKHLLSIIDIKPGAGTWHLAMILDNGLVP